MKLESMFQSGMAALASLAFPATTFVGLPFLATSMSRGALADFLVLLAVLRIVSSVDLGVASLVVPRLGRMQYASGRSSVYASSLLLMSAWSVCICVVCSLVSVVANHYVRSSMAPSVSSFFWVCTGALGYQIYTSTAGVAQLLELRPWLVLGSLVGGGLYLAPILIGVVDSPTKAMQIIALQYWSASIVCFVPVVRKIGWPTGRSGYRLAGAASFWMQTTTLAGMVALQSPLLVAGQLLGDNQVVLVGVAQQYGSVVRLGALSLAGFFVAEISSLSDSEQRSRVAARLAGVWRAVSVAVGLVFSCGAFVIVPLWMGAGLGSEAVWPSAASATASALIASTLVHTSYLRATGGQRVETIFVVRLLIGTLGFSSLLGWSLDSGLGIWIGACVASLVSVSWLLRSIPILVEQRSEIDF